MQFWSTCWSNQRRKRSLHSILDDIASAAEAAYLFQTSTKLTDHLVACGELRRHTFCSPNPSRTWYIRGSLLISEKWCAPMDDFGKAEPQLEEISVLARKNNWFHCKATSCRHTRFYWCDNDGNTTLGRGGSDYSAALLQSQYKRLA